MKEKFPANLKAHFKKKHPGEYKEIVDAECKQKQEKSTKTQSSTRNSTPKQQLTLPESVKSRRKYGIETDRYKRITRKIAIFIWATSVPISLSENSEFKDLLRVLDSCYEPPSRTKVKKRLTNENLEREVLLRRNKKYLAFLAL